MKVVQEILECGNCNIDVQDSKGNTPLHYATIQSNSKLVEYLLKRGANTHLKNSDNKTALHEAESRSFMSIIRILKDHSKERKENDCEYLLK